MNKDFIFVFHYVLLLRQSFVAHHDMPFVDELSQKPFILFVMLKVDIDGVGGLD